MYKPKDLRDLKKNSKICSSATEKNVQAEMEKFRKENDQRKKKLSKQHSQIANY